MALAIHYGCPSIAFTYNEPTIWGEYVIDICHAAREAGISTVMVTNGYVTREAFHDIYDHVDAANVDLKAFTENFYGRVTLTHLQPVLDTLTWLKQETNVWFEITNLMIPTLNDDPREIRRLADWILEHLGPDVPLHFTAFHPDFKLQRQAQDAARNAARRAENCARCRGCTTSMKATFTATRRTRTAPAAAEFSSGARGTMFSKTRSATAHVPPAAARFPAGGPILSELVNPAAIQSAETIAGKYDTFNL